MDEKNPVEAFVDHRTKESADKAQEDLRLWNQWHQAGRTAEALQPLMQRYEPVFARSQRSWKAPSVNPAAFKAELQKHFIDAAHTFEPDRGVAFNTHVQNRLKKSLRYNAQHQNVGYIPEDKSRYIGTIGRATDELEMELGRKPTAMEIGQQVGLPTQKVEGVQKSLRRDISASQFESDPIELQGSREQDVIRLMAHRPGDYLAPDEVRVFNHIFGHNGAQKITGTGALASQLGMSQSRVSRIKSSIGAKIKKNIG